MHIDELLRLVIAKGTSDSHLKAGGLPILHINGELISQGDKLPRRRCKKFASQVAKDKKWTIFANELEVDFSSYSINMFQPG